MFLKKLWANMDTVNLRVKLVSKLKPQQTNEIFVLVSESRLLTVYAQLNFWVFFNNFTKGVFWFNDYIFTHFFPIQIWCSKYRPETAMRQVDYGVHSPGKFRCNYIKRMK